VPALQLRNTSGTPAGSSDASEMTFVTRISQRIARRRRVAAVAGALVLALALGGCADSFNQVYQRGYVIPDGALEQIPLGASQEQVLIVLGTPSTVATVSGEAFYYISQRGEQPVAFMPQKVTDQRVVAVYFDRHRRVERLANYGIKDGKVFDFVSRTTPTSGQELSYLGYVFNLIPKTN
jgi:outer membrane protein assembly factor BamE (lipoprotein component of BamABCDE complex)